MKEFLNYNLTVIHNLSFFERIIPLTLVYTFITIIFIYKRQINESRKMNNILLYIFGIVLCLLLISHIILTFSSDEIPLDFLSISMLLSLILIISKNKLIYHLAFYTGIIGSLVNLLVNDPGYSYDHLKYYIFMLGYSINLFIVLYFLIVHNKTPKIKHIIISFISIQVVILLLFMINYTFNKEFFYLTYGENVAPTNHIIGKLGKWPWNLINIEIIIVVFNLLWYGVIYFIFKVSKGEELPKIESAYITKRKNNASFKR